MCRTSQENGRSTRADGRISEYNESSIKICKVWCHTGAVCVLHIYLGRYVSVEVQYHPVQGMDNLQDSSSNGLAKPLNLGNTELNMLVDTSLGSYRYKPIRRCLQFAPSSWRPYTPQPW